MIKCDVFIHSTSEHISQLCTGFSLLGQQKKIKLTYNLSPYTRDGKSPLKGKDIYGLQGMFVIINNRTALYYDTTDGEELFAGALETVDLYFKRSFRDAAVPDKYKDRVFPLGLNYELYPDGIGKLEIARFFLNKQIGKSTKQMIRSVLRNLHFKYQPTVSGMHAPPDPGRSPKVLFMTRTWDPDNNRSGVSEEIRAYSKRICTEVNQTRASIIGILRERLGDRFYGGFARDAYSSSKYNQYLLSDTRMAQKRAYINILREYPICIASTGLFSSIGWKLGEYVAFSKAIVSEKLQFEVPGNFSRDKNYLEFETADQCVEQTLLLLDNQAKRTKMMEDNHQYYVDYLAPDMLIWRTLERATG